MIVRWEGGGPSGTVPKLLSQAADDSNALLADRDLGWKLGRGKVQEVFFRQVNA